MYKYFKNIALTVTAAISAIGNANHTKSTFPNFDSKNATGNKNINCLTNETNILNIPFPNAWNVEDAIIENPANTKLTLIILSAGIPIDNICSDALNIFNNGPGIACIITSPINIIPTA